MPWTCRYGTVQCALVASVSQGLLEKPTLARSRRTHHQMHTGTCKFTTRVESSGRSGKTEMGQPLLDIAGEDATVQFYLPKAAERKSGASSRRRTPGCAEFAGDSTLLVLAVLVLCTLIANESDSASALAVIAFPFSSTSRARVFMTHLTDVYPICGSSDSSAAFDLVLSSGEPLLTPKLRVENSDSFSITGAIRRASNI